MYLRMLTVSRFSRSSGIAPNSQQSSQIRLHRGDYEGFIVHPDTQKPMDIVSFCSHHVDPLGKEAGKFVVSSFDIIFPNHSPDNVAVEALCRALNLNVDVAYLNGSKSDDVDFIKIRHGIQTAPPISLLYR